MQESMTMSVNQHSQLGKQRKARLLRLLTICIITITIPETERLRAADSGWHVWTVTTTTRVLRSDPPADTRAVKLAAARNEWESFQILVRSDAPVKGVRVEAGTLHGPGQAVLDTSQARLYRQHQLNLEVGTYRNQAFKPDWYPDPLIPFKHPAPGKDLAEGPYQAMPFDLPASQTHGFWVDLYVPPSAKPGEYHGVYRVTNLNGRAVDIPVSLTVWDFALPRVSSLVTAFGSPAQRMRDYYRQRAKAGTESEPKDWDEVEAQCAQLLTEHRINATPPPENLRPVAQADGSFRIPAEQLSVLRKFIARYNVNALQIPHPSSVIKDPDVERDRLRAWLTAFDHAARELARQPAGPEDAQPVFYIYLRDEPNTLEDYRYVQKWGRAIREAKSLVKVMVVEQTWTEPGQGGADSAWGNLYGAVDIWCPLFSLHRQDSAAERQALGETIWTYTALCQGKPTPWWHIDYPLLNYRVPTWIAWRYRMRGLLYWGGMSYWREVADPWVQAPVYTGRGAFQQGSKGIVFNGEGSLVYPARAAGYDGIVSTLRLKALRDSIEDYDYLAILERQGKTAEADKIVRPLAESWFAWEKDPAAYQTARAQLAALITTAPGADSATTTPANTRARTPATGPLRVHPANPRYFANGAGKVIYLTGAHTWNNLQDMGPTNPPPAFDFDRYLHFLERHNHNFIRLWRWELVRWDTAANQEKSPRLHFAAPHPWARTGPGLALDGQPKFNLNQFDEAYFKRLRARVAAARDRGIYVAIMLFEGWGMQFVPDGWKAHPFHPANNVNGLDGDVDGDGRGLEIHTLRNLAVTALQETYVKKLIDTVNDLDNVLYEVSNENHPPSTQWQYHFIRFIHDYERHKPKQHPVGMTFQYKDGANTALFESPAEWISPNQQAQGGYNYRNNPPPADGRKVILSDTDHLWGIGGDVAWVWKSFLRGLNPLFMDPYDNSILSRGSEQQWQRVRQALGHTRQWANRVDLAAMVPLPNLASSQYCLAKLGNQYLVFLPGGGEVTLDLSAASGPLNVEWFNPNSGTTTNSARIQGGEKSLFESPFDGDSVLYVGK
jgi:hypothetical protein